jgi:DNA mismatch repair protein MutS2
MDKKHLRTLEFPQILGRLAHHITFSAGKDLALALEPSSLFAEVEHRQQETREARYLLDTYGGLPLGGAHDVRKLAHNATRGAILQPSHLLDVYHTLRVGLRVQRVLARHRQQVPSLADLASRIEPCEGLAAEITRCISDQGEVVDHASPKLSRIRHEMRTAHDRLQEKINRIVTNARNATYLQEALVTQRGGRYVIPLKAEFRGRIPGIVHDTSASGATLFIEPLSIVDMGNRWREFQLEEEKEIERILAELSAHVAALAEEVAWTVDALAELDLIMAKARYANALDASQPVLFPLHAQPSGGHPASALDLRQARHPLLDPESVVPIDVQLSEGNFSLVITGPNTGGKTVTLKTVGLMAAMAQSGLHLPVADGSVLPVFEGIYADIGDEQSIEQSLSTFSSHLTNIVDILDRSDDRSLVLLDELGAGTDPVEGSALARAILSYFLERRITTMVATHYSELKAFAHTTPGVENASVEFDVQTLAPTYRLQVGLPGRSNAFAIAQRLGLAASIVRAAQVLVSPEELETESLLAEIQQAHRESVLARDEAVLAQQRLAEKEHRLEARLAAIEGERATILGEARAEARQELAKVRREVELLKAEIADRKGQSHLGEQWLADARARLAEQEEEMAETLSPPLDSVRLPGKIAVGDTVWVAGLGTLGQVSTLDEGSAEVQVGSFRVRVQQRDLERRQSSSSHPQDAGTETHTIVRGIQASPGVELDLRGKRVEEILPRLDKYLDDAFLAGLPFVRIIHGKGTGTLRQAVDQQLRDHPLVRSYRRGEHGEGGSGVTVAYLVEG